MTRQNRNKLPNWILIDSSLKQWLVEDIGRGDCTTEGLLRDSANECKAEWRLKEAGVVAGLPVAARVFYLLDKNIKFLPLAEEGEKCESGRVVATIKGRFDQLLTAERVALNLAMRLSGIATLTSKYVETIVDLPVRLVDTRKTTPGLRILEKYATRIGGGTNHRLGLDDAVMIKDNHIQAAGSISAAIATIKNNSPYPLSFEVETSNLEEVQEALEYNADIIMLDNMSLDMMHKAVGKIRSWDKQVKIEASGNITLKNIRAVAETGVDYISTSAPITRSSWLDLSMKFVS